MPYLSSNKKKYRLKPVPILTAILILLILVFIILLFVKFVGKSDDKKSKTNNTQSAQTVSKKDSPSSKEPVLDAVANSSKPASELASEPLTVVIPEKITNTYDTLILNDVKKDEEIWNLILLNQSYYIEKELKFDDMKFDGQVLDKRAGEYYEKMAAKAKSEGVNLFLRSGYRTIKLQKSYYDANVKLYMDQGNSKEKADELTRLYYTQPGHSEHHSGLGADIITTEYQRDVTALDERFEATDGYKWLMENCNDFGFILRYPKEKEKMTTVNFEPWHYRFVGIDHAQAIQKSGMCFEEYIESMHLTFEKSVNGLDLTAEQKQEKFIAFTAQFPKML